MIREEKKPSYKDYKIGQTVTCVRTGHYEQHITVGNKYEIVDLDYHFPDAICIKPDSKLNGIFLDIDLFYDPLTEERDKKINILLS